MPKGNFLKLKGSICNVNLLPQGADSNDLVFIVLECKLTYSGHVYFEAVRPELLYQTLMYLKKKQSTIQ